MKTAHFQLYHILIAALVTAIISVFTTLYIVNFEEDLDDRIETSQNQSSIESEVIITKVNVDALTEQALKEPIIVSDLQDNPVVEPKPISIESSTEFISADIPEDAIIYSRKLSEKELARADASLLGDIPVYSTKLSAEKLNSLDRESLSEANEN